MAIVRRSVIFSGVIAVLVIAEVLARTLLGLGSPPLFITHPTIEYLYKPNQSLYRFGNYFRTNQYGMRSEPFELNKQADEYRIMVFGDSVVAGGAQTDHKDLATTLISRMQFGDGKRRVTVGNISAGSWGPGNWLAYAREYGFFDADAVVLVASSHDYADNPTFEVLNSDTHPSEKPVSALWEGLVKYGLKFSENFFLGRATGEADHFDKKPMAKAIDSALRDLSAFLDMALHHTSMVIVIQHPERVELYKNSKSDGYQTIQEICERMHVIHYSFDAPLRASIFNGIEPYRDNIHLNSKGQKLLANLIANKLRLSERQISRRTDDDSID